MSNYRGNIGSLLQSDFAIYQRVDPARATKIARSARKSGNWPTLSVLQQRYKINEAEAKKLLTAAKRYQAKLIKDAKALEASRSERRAMIESLVYPPTAPVKPAVPVPDVEPLGVNIPALITTPVESEPEQQLGEILAGIRNKYGEELRKHGEQTTIPEGFVYLVTHELFTGWVKAGMTIDYEVRLGTYNVSDPLSRFRFAALKWFPNRRQAEAKLLMCLSEEAYKQAGEWFEMPLDLAKMVFDAALDALNEG